MRALVRLALLPVVLLVPAGTARWWEGWAVIGIFWAWAAAVAIDLARHDPELLRERLGGSRTGQPGWDRAVLLAMIPAGLAVVALPGLGVRFGWTRLPVAAEVAGLSLLAAAMALTWRVMRENRWLARVVKVGAGQQVITTGPYAIVRHPLYLAVAGAVVALPVALGSGWGLVASAAFVGLLGIRTGLEDRHLQASLPGYAAYAAKTRSRLIPGIW